MNISSLIVHARPGSADALRTRLEALDGVEVHAVSGNGKLIVTIESNDDRGTADTYESIGRTDGVLSVSMVFQQTENDPDKEVGKCN